MLNQQDGDEQAGATDEWRSKFTNFLPRPITISIGFECHRRADECRTPVTTIASYFQWQMRIQRKSWYYRPRGSQAIPEEISKLIFIF